MADKTTNKARLIVLAIFSIGFVSGLLAMNLYERFNSKNEDPRPERGQPPYVYVTERINRRVNLTPEQKTQVQEILTDQFDQFDKIRDEMRPKMKEFEPRFAEVRRLSRDKVRAVLSAEQLPEFEKLLEEDDKKREEQRQKEEQRKEERRQREEQKQQQEPQPQK